MTWSTFLFCLVIWSTVTASFHVTVQHVPWMQPSQTLVTFCNYLTQHQLKEGNKCSTCDFKRGAANFQAILLYIIPYLLTPE
jgi:hypothetical protein